MPKTDQKYTVLHKQVGPFPQLNADGTPFIFSDSQFRELHPASHLTSEDDKEKYHKGLIQRLLDLKAIAPTTSDAETNTPPLGAEFDGLKNPAAPKPPAPVAEVKK